MTEIYEVRGICRDTDRTEYVLQRNGEFEHPNQSDNAIEFYTVEDAHDCAALYHDDDFYEIIASAVEVY